MNVASLRLYNPYVKETCPLKPVVARVHRSVMSYSL